MQHEIINNHNLLDDSGKLIEAGYSKETKLRFNKENSTIKKVSPYIFLSEADVIDCVNIDFPQIPVSIMRRNHSEFYDNEVLFFCLRLIKAFDLTKTEKYLIVSSDLLDWLEAEKYIEKYIITMNKLQIIKRIRNLNDDEIAGLEDLIKQYKNHTDAPYIMAGIYILLEDKENFVNCFNNFSEENKKEFMEYPIYNLIKSTV